MEQETGTNTDIGTSPSTSDGITRIEHSISAMAEIMEGVSVARSCVSSQGGKSGLFYNLFLVLFYFISFSI